MCVCVHTHDNIKYDVIGKTPKWKTREEDGEERVVIIYTRSSRRRFEIFYKRTPTVFP